MSHRLTRRVLTLVLSFGVLVASLHAQPPPAQGAAADQPPPKDLRPLLTARQSEMRLVTVRYTLDRTTLAGNYLGGGRGRGARGGAPVAPPEPLSPNRIARLKRFDLDWQTALAGPDRAALTPAGRAELETLETTVQSNLRQLDADGVTLARLTPFVPFGPAIVRLVEARIRMEDSGPGEGRRRADRDDERNRARSRRPREGTGRWCAGGRHPGRERPGGAGAGRRGPAPVEPQRVVHLLQRVRPALHLVERAALQESRRGAAGVRGGAAREDCGDRRGLAGGVRCRVHRHRAGRPAQVPLGTRSQGAHRPSPGRDDRHRPAVPRARAGRPRRRGPGRRAPRPRVLRELAQGAPDARLRQALAQRTGGLPLHQEDRGAADCPRGRRACREPAAKDRRLRHRREGARPAGLDLRPPGRARSLHARGTDRDRRDGVRMVRGGDEEVVTPAGPGRRLEGRAREDEGDPPAAGRPGRRHPRPDVRGGGLPPDARPADRARRRGRVAAHDHDDARAAAGEPLLHGRDRDQRVVPDRHDGLRRPAPEHAGQQHAVLARDGLPRDDSRATTWSSTRAPATGVTAPRSAAAARSTARAGRSTGS